MVDVSRSDASRVERLHRRSLAEAQPHLDPRIVALGKTAGALVTRNRHRKVPTFDSDRTVQRFELPEASLIAFFPRAILPHGAQRRKRGLLVQVVGGQRSPYRADLCARRRRSQAHLIVALTARVGAEPSNQRFSARTCGHPRGSPPRAPGPKSLLAADHLSDAKEGSGVFGRAERMIRFARARASRGASRRRTRG